MKYDTVIFDLDGTLLDTLADLTDSVNFALQSLNFPLRTIDEIHGFVGNGIRKLIYRSLPEDSRSDEIVGNALGLFRQFYDENMAVKTVPYPGIIDLLRILKSKNIKIGIASNKADFAVQKLNKYFFDGLDILALGESQSMTRKPSPDMINFIRQQFHSQNVLYVGDSDTDVQTALNAEVDQISVLWGYRNKQQLFEAGATYFVETPDEIVKIVEFGGK